MRSTSAGWPRPDTLSGSVAFVQRDNPLLYLEWGRGGEGGTFSAGVATTAFEGDAISAMASFSTVGERP